MTDCKESCWCKIYPHRFSEMYEAIQPLLSRIERLESTLKIHMEKSLKTQNMTHERVIKCEKVLFSRNPHKCPICKGKRVVEYGCGRRVSAPAKRLGSCGVKV